MRFMGFVKMEEGIAAPPQALMDAMEVFIGESVANGQFLDGGGLYGTEDSVNFVIRKGETTRVDGPYSEVKEVIGGYSVLEFASREDAIENTRRMADLHAEHWPEADVTVTLRQISDHAPESAG
ncbi:MAG: YciI family protein [Marmoricola sp.]